MTEAATRSEAGPVARDPAGAVVVTGASGFIGRALVRRLLDDGRRVVAVTRSARYACSDAAGAACLEVRRGDLREPAFAAEAFRGAAAIVHLAALPPTEVRSAFELYHGNVEMAQAVARAAGESGAGSLVWASSALVYGTKRSEALGEDAGLDPKGPYATAKAVGEWLARGATRISGQTLTILRPFNCYGPGQGAEAFLGRLVAQARAGAGLDVEHLDAVRDFVFLDDVVAALVAVLDRAPGDELVLNIGSGSATPLARAVELVRSLASADLDLRVAREAVEIDHLVGDVSRAATALGWRPRIGLSEGLARTMQHPGVACPEDLRSADGVT